MSLPLDIKFEHVTSRKNKNGTIRYYFRRRGQPVERLPDDPQSEEFAAAYNRLLNWVAPALEAQEGSFAWACDQYMDSPEFKGKADATRTARRRIIISMMKERLDPAHTETFGQEKLARITAKHVRVLRDRKADNPNAANERLKILSQVFKLALAKDWVESNPVRIVERLAVPRGGHDTASDEHIARYMAKHSSGAPWLAIKMLMEFGMRVSDLRILGRQHVKNGYLIFDTVKTGVRCELEISADMQAILPRHETQMTFLLSEYGNPFKSDKALSQRVSKWFRQAGVEGITAHSVRKWLATRKAEEGATEMQLMAWFGWNDPKEARPYVQKANRRKLASQIGPNRVTQRY